VEASAFALNEVMRGSFQQRAMGLTTRSAAEDAEILLDLFFHGVLNHNYQHDQQGNQYEEQLS
jgi:hypothetical protein